MVTKQVRVCAHVWDWRDVHAQSQSVNTHPNSTRVCTQKHTHTCTAHTHAHAHYSHILHSQGNMPHIAFQLLSRVPVLAAHTGNPVPHLTSPHLTSPHFTSPKDLDLSFDLFYLFVCVDFGLGDNLQSKQPLQRVVLSQQHLETCQDSK